MNIPYQARLAIELLKNSFFEAYLVGGCVRDFLLKIPPKDWDIATSATPDDIKTVFAKYKIIEIGAKYGTISVLIEELLLEITTFRIDGNYKDKRRPDFVYFTRSLKKDLSRRDFTINAIALSSDGKILDFFDGVNDLKLKILRCVGTPDTRLSEDALRILRALRFCSLLNFKVEELTANSIHKNKDLLKNVSAERKRVEFEKILCSKNVYKIIFEFVDVVGILVPEILNTIDFNQKNLYHHLNLFEHILKTVENVSKDKNLRFAAFFHDIGKPDCFSEFDSTGQHYPHTKSSCKIAEKNMKKLKFSKASLNEVLMLIEHHDCLIRPITSDIRRFLNKLGENTFYKLLNLKRANIFAQNPKFFYREIKVQKLEKILKEVIDKNMCFSLKNLKINGKDIMALGYRGRKVGNALIFLLNATINEEVANNKEDLIAFLIEKYQN